MNHTGQRIRIRCYCLVRAILSPLFASAGVLMMLSSSAVYGGSLVAPYMGAGDPEKGEQVYVRCIACHSLDRNRTGPMHCGLIGRVAGTVEGYEYSRAMIDYGVVWNELSLDKFIQAPLSALPGTTMGFAGIKDDQIRNDLIAYLMQASVSAACR